MHSVSKAAQSELSELVFPLTVTEINKILPHRYPFLLVDRVIEFVDGDRVVGIKNVSANEAFFEGHFPGKPIMPGVMILEALAQMGAIYAKLHFREKLEQKLIVFSGADSVRFRRPVIPGDILRLEMTNCARKFGHWKIHGKATVEGELAAEAVVMATEVDF